MKRITIASLLGVLTATTALSEQVVLRSLDGSISITGDLVKFEDGIYSINSAVGTMGIAAALVECEGPGCPAPEELVSEFKISGASSLGERLLPELLFGYGDTLDADLVQRASASGESNYEIQSLEGTMIASVDINASNSSDGFADLLGARTTLALSSRPARNREVRAFSEAGLGELRDRGQEHIVALDGLLIVTSQDNPVRAITEQNAALAFAGRINNWSQLGGPNAPINLYVRGSDSGTREVFDNLLMRPAALQVGGRVNVLESDDAVSDAVANDPNGLGFTSFASLQNAKALAIEGVCGLQTPPSAFAIKTEEYPLTRLLYVYSSDRAMPYHARGLLNYATSEEAQDLVSEAGFVNQSISQASIGSQGLRLASAVVANQDFSTFPQLQEMVNVLIASDRLSTTFRFETGSSDLDARAQADIVRLADLLAGDAFRNKEVVFVGFTDSVGDEELNRQLSEQRAGQVLSALLAQDPTLSTKLRTRAIGYGEISPLGCNETNTGRRINRRVEVWVRDVVVRN